jgi:hypothetical protein
MSEIESPRSFLLDWQSAEVAAVNHMKTIGFIDAQVTAPGADGGIDAHSSEAAAQVKFYANPIGRPDVQRLRGAAHEYRLPLFYSTGGYTSEAVAYATQANVALFLMDPYGVCEPISPLATLLVLPEHVHDRRHQLEELQVIRYRHAAAALESDLTLYAQLARDAFIGAEESRLYSHVASALEIVVQHFRIAAETRDFVHADLIFGEILKRTAFLYWTAGSELTTTYTDLEEAIAEGWRRDATPGSDHLLQRVASGVVELKSFLNGALDSWSEEFPEGTNRTELIDVETLTFNGMLLTVSLDEALLSPPLLRQLKTSVRMGVERGHRAATKVFEHLLDLHDRLELDRPRELIAARLHTDALASRILSQLAASN